MELSNNLDFIDVNIFLQKSYLDVTNRKFNDIGNIDELITLKDISIYTTVRKLKKIISEHTNMSYDDLSKVEIKILDSYLKPKSILNEKKLKTGKGYYVSFDFKQMVKSGLNFDLFTTFFDNSKKMWYIPCIIIKKIANLSKYGKEIIYVIELQSIFGNKNVYRGLKYGQMKVNENRIYTSLSLELSNVFDRLNDLTNKKDTIDMDIELQNLSRPLRRILGINRDDYLLLDLRDLNDLKNLNICIYTSNPNLIKRRNKPKIIENINDLSNYLNNNKLKILLYLIIFGILLTICLIIVNFRKKYNNLKKKNLKKNKNEPYTITKIN